MVEIKTERLLLRPAKASDAPALFEVFGDPKAMRYWSEAPHDMPERTAGFVEGMIRLGADTRYFTIEHHGRAVGTAGFWQGNEVGYILHQRLWRQGFGREVLRALIAHGFGNCGFETITADVDPRNEASIAMLLAHGFAETGRAEKTLLIGKDWADSIYFALTTSSDN